MSKLGEHMRAAALARQKATALAGCVWHEAARIGRNLAFDMALNTWHYSQSVSHSAGAAAAHVLQRQDARPVADASAPLC